MLYSLSVLTICRAIKEERDDEEQDDRDDGGDGREHRVAPVDIATPLATLGGRRGSDNGFAVISSGGRYAFVTPLRRRDGRSLICVR
jgi:hypothetical protein